MCVCSCVSEKDREATALDGSGAITSLYKSIGPCLAVLVHSVLACDWRNLSI